MLSAIYYFKTRQYNPQIFWNNYLTQNFNLYILIERATFILRNWEIEISILHMVTIVYIPFQLFYATRQRITLWSRNILDKTYTTFVTGISSLTLNLKQRSDNGKNWFLFYSLPSPDQRFSNPSVKGMG